MLLRQQLAEKNQRGERTSAGKTATPSSHRAGSSPGADIRDAIRTQIGALRAAGVDDERILFRIAIELLLQREFGAGLGNDPSFQRMGDWVCTVLHEQEHTREILRTLIDT